MLDLVCTAVATVLGRDRGDAIDPDKGFLELGLDSLTAVEFRNRLDRITGRRLPATLIFDYPSATALAARLRAEVTGNAASALDDHVAALEAALRAGGPGGLGANERVRITGRLRTLVFAADGAGPAEASHDDVEAASMEQLFGILDQELES